MIKNDILRRIRYILDLNDEKMIALFKSVDHNVSIKQLHAWFRKEDHEHYQQIKDTELALFLNGLINDRRGKKPGPNPPVDGKLTNNKVFMKLKIALNLRAPDVLEILNLADFSLSKHELSAFFRNPGHKHYRECKDQVMRNFLMGLQLKYRPNEDSNDKFSWT